MTAELPTACLSLRAELDARPGDVALACALADELQACGADEGYVALTRLDRVPWQDYDPKGWYWCPCDLIGEYRWLPGHCDRSCLPADWLTLIEGKNPHDPNFSAEFLTRADAERAACLAFARLPAGRRAELLRGEWGI